MAATIPTIFDHLFRKFNEQPERDKENDIENFVLFCKEQLKRTPVSTTNMASTGATVLLTDGTYVSLGEEQGLGDDYKMDDGGIPVIGDR